MPEVAPQLVVSNDNKVSFVGHGVGVQIYVWSGTSWVFQAPMAILYDNDGNIVATHFAGPRWKSNSGSEVLGFRIDGVIVDHSAIPWLKLGVASASGPGIFANTSFIQRVNTVGGIAPPAAGLTVGELASVAYEADYVFYRPK